MTLIETKEHLARIRRDYDEHRAMHKRETKMKQPAMCGECVAQRAAIKYVEARVRAWHLPAPGSPTLFD